MNQMHLVSSFFSSLLNFSLFMSGGGRGGRGGGGRCPVGDFDYERDSDRFSDTH